MADWTLPNIKTGTNITVQGDSLAQAQQNAANATGVSLAQQKAAGTFGGNTNSSLFDSGPAPAASGGGGGGQQQQGTMQLDPQDKAALQNFFGQTSGFSREQLAESARQFNEDLAFKKQQWEQENIPKLEIQQRLAQLEDEKFRADLQLARSQQGMAYLQAAAQMGGPASVFQQADFLHGAQQRGDVPVFLSALAQNTQLPSFQGTSGNLPTPQTAGGLALQLGGGQTVTIPPNSSEGQPMTFTTGPLAGAQPAATSPSVAAPAGASPTALPAATGQGTGMSGLGAPVTPGQRGPAYVNNGQVVQETRNANGTVSYAILGAAPPGAANYTAATSIYTSPVAASTSTPAGPALSTTGSPATTNTTPGLGTDPAGYSYDQALSQIGNIFKAGPTALKPGTLEQLDPNELAILQSGAQKLGVDYNSWLRAYQKASVGQTAGSPA